MGELLSPKLYMRCDDQDPQKCDFLYTNFSVQLTTYQCIPFSIEKHPILSKLGVFFFFNNNLFKIHSILCILGSFVFDENPSRIAYGPGPLIISKILYVEYRQGHIFEKLMVMDQKLKPESPKSCPPHPGLNEW